MPCGITTLWRDVITTCIGGNPQRNHNGTKIILDGSNAGMILNLIAGMIHHNLRSMGAWSDIAFTVLADPIQAIVGWSHGTIWGFGLDEQIGVHNIDRVEYSVIFMTVSSNIVCSCKRQKWFSIPLSRTTSLSAPPAQPRQTTFITRGSTASVDHDQRSRNGHTHHPTEEICEHMSRFWHFWYKLTAKQNFWVDDRQGLWIKARLHFWHRLTTSVASSCWVTSSFAMLHCDAHVRRT
jgi:hypothetical protein